MDKDDKKEIAELYKKLAEATKEVGNLSVQNAEYSQIVKELSDKIKNYENLHGSVFRPGRNTSAQK